MTAAARPWWIAGGVLLLAGAWLRAHNALHYPPLTGFDAEWNWQYIALLMRRWTLPAPDAGWSTAHPPLFYAMSAAIGRALGRPGMPDTVQAIRLVSATLGLGTVAAAVAMVRRAAPNEPRRALIAAGLLLFLPVHIYMSAMLTEEILASFLVSLTVVGVAWETTRPDGADRPLATVAVLGALGGLALLTKLSGALVIAAGAGAYLLDGWRRGELGAALQRAVVFGAVASTIGGWFYLRNLIQYGYLYPHALDVHSIMFTMPPGVRELGDYVRFPLATFHRPDLLSPELLRSVWGSTYVTVWFDGHRHFLPREAAGLAGAGSALLVLGLVPTLAFVVGVGRGARRAIRAVPGPDAVLLALVALSLAGYAAFAWRNPAFVTLKGSFLLGLSVPFAYYASEVLASWTGSNRVLATLVWVSLAALVLLAAITFCFGALFLKSEPPGIDWIPLETPWH